MAQACAACGGQLVGGKFCPHCGAPVPQAAAAVDPLVGQELGPYRVLKPLAEGGMGKIYVGEQTSLGRKVCIKTLRPDDAGDQKVIARFEREARAVSALRHPNVAQVYDFGRQGTWFYLVMELVEGRTLRALMDQDAPLPLERACTLMTQILSALEEAHASGIIHRDLKPENVLVARLRDGSDLAKVVDFGIARVIDAEYREGHLTGTGLVCGTPGYMSPEQITGDTLDARADVYAAGVVMFEMLTGKAPFAAPSLADLLRLHLTADPPRPSRVTSLPVSTQVDELLLRALSRDREQRIPTALEFKRAVEALRPSTQQHGTAVMPAVAGVAVTCAACGAANAPTQKFCGGCGANLAGGDSSSGVHALTRVLPSQLVGHLSDLSPSLAAEKRHVTLLLGALSGLDGFGLTPDAARQLTTRCLNGLMEAAARYEGTVDKLIGDSVTVVFGAPRAHEDDPERAVRCALDMQAFVTQLGAALQRPLKLKVGVALGEVVTGQGRVDAAALAPLLKQAEALAEACAPGKVEVSGAVKRATEHVVRFRASGEGADRHEVEALGAPVKREPLVGREQELARFDELLAQVKAGRPGGVLFVADAGLGKSRLLDELASRARAAGLAVAQARPRRQVGAAQLEVLRDCFLSLADDAPPGADIDGRLAHLATRGVQAADVKRLAALLGTAAAPAGYDAEERRRLDVAAVVQAFKDVAWKARGLVLVVDDADRVDQTTAGFLSELVGQAGGVPLAVVASARPVDAVPGLERLPRRPLGGLSPPEVKTLLEQQLSGPVPAQVVDTVVERSEGSPFVARELARTLVDNGVLTLQGGVWRSSSTLPGATLPLSVAQLFSARFDALSSASRQLLRCASLFGRVFPLELVAAALGARAQDLQAAVTECTRRGFLEHVESPPGCLAFKAELFLQTVASGIPEAEAKALHRALGEALEKGLPSGDAHPAEAMARHFEAAGHRRKASTYFSAAAERLVNRNAFAAATDSYLRAIRLVEAELVAAQVTDVGAWGHYLELAAKTAAVQGVVSPPAALALVDEALKKAPTGTPPRLKGECLKQRGELLLKLGRASDAEAALTEALDALARDLTPDGRAAIEVDVSAAREARGDFGAATLLLVEALKRIAGVKLKDRDLLWRTLNQLGRLHLKTGQAARAKEFFENAVAQARQVRSAVGETRALCNLAGALGASGDAKGAEKVFLDALELARGAHDRIDLARIEFNLGKLAAAQGRTAEARTRLEAALALATQVAWREGLAAATQALSALK